MRLTTVFWFAASLALSACGGQVEQGGGTDDGEGAVSEEEQPDGMEPTPPRTAGGSKLPECAPGFAPEEQPARDCDWLGAGLCYATKLEACACVCPRSQKESTCISGFGYPNARERVTCY